MGILHKTRIFKTEGCSGFNFLYKMSHLPLSIFQAEMTSILQIPESCHVGSSKEKHTIRWLILFHTMACHNIEDGWVWKTCSQWGWTNKANCKAIRQLVTVIESSNRNDDSRENDWYLYSCLYIIISNLFHFARVVQHSFTKVNLLNVY